MISIRENNEIKMTKGDSAYLDVDISYSTGKPYTIHDGDKIELTVRHALSDEILFQKKIQAGKPFIITPTDTSNAKVGRYKYDIQLTTTLGEVCTVIPKSRFCIEEEVTHE